MRWLALSTGAFLVAAAFLAGSRVADTREGLIYEVVTLLAGLVGVSLILYGTFARRAPAPRAEGAASPPSTATLPRVHSANELLAGVVGLVVGAVLVTGLALSGGTQWAVLGLIALLPMIVGSAYLCWAFIRGPHREWKVDLSKLSFRR